MCIRVYGSGVLDMSDACSQNIGTTHQTQSFASRHLAEDFEIMCQTLFSVTMHLTGSTILAMYSGLIFHSSASSASSGMIKGKGNLFRDIASFTLVIPRSVMQIRDTSLVLGLTVDTRN